MLKPADFDASAYFLKRWQPEGPWCLTAIESDGKGIQSRTFYPNDEDELKKWLINFVGKWNIYFHVNTPTHDLVKKANREDIKEVVALHIDLDPRVGEDLEEERQRCLKLLQEPPEGVPKPTVCIFSGGGYQGFWKLEEPIKIDGDLAKAEDAKRYNQQLEVLFGADNCHNIDRIMRLPGTINVPDAKKKKKGRTPTLATLEWFDEEAVYPISDFTPAPIVQSAADLGFSSGQTVQVSGNIERVGDVEELNEWNVPDRIKVIIVQGRHPEEGPKAADDSRSAWLFDCVCGLVRCDVPDDVIFAILTDPDFGISESVLDKGSNSEKYAVRQIERAHEQENPTWIPTDESGCPRRSFHNTVVALRQMGVDCYYDLFRRRYFIGYHELQEFAGEFCDQAEILLRKFVRERFGFEPGKENIRDAVLELCAENRVDPLFDHLAELPQWDGIKRLDCWLSRYLGAEDNAYTREVGTAWVLAAIARAKKPGIKFDHMMVLVGSQGVGKSTALRILAGNDFFSDANFLGARDSREVIEATEGAWILECAELAGMQKRDAETLKHEITKQEDKGRPAYGRNTVTISRRFVLAGTTNSHRFLQDDTGNRRFWPVETKCIDLESLKKDRDQLWAEALCRYESGEYQLYLTGEANQLAAIAQDERLSVNEAILECLEGLKSGGSYKGQPAIPTETVYGRLEIPKDRRGGKLATDVKRAMEVLGWCPTKTSVKWQGKRQRLYLWVGDGDGAAPEHVTCENQFD